MKLRYSFGGRRSTWELGQDCELCYLHHILMKSVDFQFVLYFSKTKDHLDAEIEIIKLKEEITKLKKNHYVEVIALKTKLEEHKSEKDAIQKELEKFKKPKIILSVSNNNFI